MATDGFSYDLEAISEWLSTNSSQQIQCGNKRKTKLKKGKVFRPRPDREVGP